MCDLLSCDTRVLVSALKQRTVDTGGEKVRTDLSAAEVRSRGVPWAGRGGMVDRAGRRRGCAVCCGCIAIEVQSCSNVW